MRSKAYVPFLWAVVLALLIVACGSGVEPISAPKASPQSQSAGTQAQVIPVTRTPAPEPPTIPAGTGIQLTLQTSTKVWLRVVADGEQVFEGQLKDGTQMTWTAQERLVLRTSNAGGVQASVNGQPFMRLGPFGKVLEREYRLGDGQVKFTDLK